MNNVHVRKRTQLCCAEWSRSYSFKKMHISSVYIVQHGSSSVICCFYVLKNLRFILNQHIIWIILYWLSFEVLICKVKLIITLNVTTHTQTYIYTILPKVLTLHLAQCSQTTAKPRLVHQIARSVIRHSRERVSTALEHSGGVLYSIASDTLDCTWWCMAWMQLLGHGNPFHEALYALFLN